METDFADGTVVEDESTRSAQYSSEGDHLIGSVVVKSGTTMQTFACEVAEPPPATAALGGVVWYDGSQLTQDGVRDPGEQGIPGILVDLYAVSDTLVGTTATDRDGRYLFQGLAPGTYVVEFVRPGE